MKFVKIGNKYYNTALIGWTVAVDVEGTMKYFVQFVGGRQQEITYEEYMEIRNSGGGGGGTVVNADNGVLGVVEGTDLLGASADTLVNISNGRIVDILIKDQSTYESIRGLILGNKDNISAIQELIPSNASASNKLVDKKYVDDTIGNINDILEGLL